MVRQVPEESRQTALRFCALALGWLGCVLAWVSLLTFDVADAPGITVWPHPTPPHNLFGHVGATLAHHAFRYFGTGAYALVFLLNAAILAWSQRVQLKDLWLRAVGLALAVTSTAAGGTLLLGAPASFPWPGAGGVLGAATLTFLTGYVQSFGAVLILALALVVGLVLAADNLLVALFRWLRWASEHSAPVIVRGGAAVAGAGAAVAEAGAAVANGVSSLSGKLAAAARESAPPAERPARQLDLRPEPAETDEPENERDDEDGDEFEADDVVGAADEEEDAAPAPGEVARAEAAETDVPRGPTPGAQPQVTELGRTPMVPRRPPPRHSYDENYVLPPIELLERPVALDRGAIEAGCREKAYVLEQTLNEFRLEVQVVAIETGPVITVFELKLAPGIKVSQIASLSNDMARALKAPAVRVVAPLPGKSTIGIEVPNIDKEKVRLRDVMEMAGSRADQFAIPLFLGKDASGQPLVTDLTRMPHLLIAGTTGSGKSVCITSIIMSLLLTRSPAEVNMILVDPKVVELAMYKDVPHLMCPIITEISKAEAILDWASTKMDERYALLAEVGVKDIRSYNRLGRDGLRERIQPSCEEEMEQIPVRLPYIVIMIDELADLMMTSSKEVEFYLCRIAQKSRAVGIHLIVSTQRPQANVVTGLIKSNLPSRIAFRVSSRLDSRIVLDQNGAEVLMGQGDMLFLPPGQSKLVRAQGTFVDDDELRTVVRHCKEQHPQVFHPELIRLPGANGESSTERDELFDAAVDVILETRRGSVSLLQRRFNVGYSRASRLVDQMYAAGIVGEYKGSQAREVNITKEEWEAIKAQRDREETQEADELPNTEDRGSRIED